ncbi:DUF3102 domain-containing protein [Dendronalium sp. ChiSLP03b]|uniref:DUF3102 domain-containing protein n=1 Tax=Dendronalium sp. ChiSLP03b TaxID=3075381 RepID=UPI002AD42BA5|nr:DUF3102 domain-containing protein [Dendronalium sp. ChiSLP03b]MDZ8206585.1 DUF3102 domain-containing protein [Dendronalium sp. ChiSLP03b]
MSKLKKQSQVVTGFNYEILDSEQRIVIQQRTGEIKERLRRSAQDIWEIGQKLADVRSRLKHGQFETWLKAEFGWSRRTAYNFINVYEAFAERANFAQINIATSALYLLAAPSTPENIRQEILQRAKGGETLTHKSIRQVIKEEKSQSTSAASLEPPQSVTCKPEIVTIIPKEAVKVETPVSEVTVAKTSSVSPVASTPDEIQSSWFLLEKQHFLFCGDTASSQFVERIPFAALAIAITSDDWDHDWLVERAKTVIIFPESDFKEGLIEQLIEMFSASGNTVIFPWLPSMDMIKIAHQLNRRVFAGDPDIERCRQAIAHLGLKTEPLDYS